MNYKLTQADIDYCNQLSNHKGFWATHNQILNSEIWELENKTANRAFTALMSIARFSKKEINIMGRQLKRGDVFIKTKQLAYICRYKTATTILDALKKLKELNMIDFERADGNFYLVKIVNYDKYQGEKEVKTKKVEQVNETNVQPKEPKKDLIKDLTLKITSQHNVLHNQHQRVYETIQKVIKTGKIDIHTLYSRIGERFIKNDYNSIAGYANKIFVNPISLLNFAEKQDEKMYMFYNNGKKPPKQSSYTNQEPIEQEPSEPIVDEYSDMKIPF